MSADVSSEFTFELRCCRWAEREWSDFADPAGPVVVARQLGTKHRRWDTIIIECSRAGLARRARFGPERLDSDLLHVVRHAPANWAYYREALPDPGYPWRYVREAIHEAADRGVIRRRREGNRIEIRRRWPYPNWVDRIVAIENKPDLDASAARALGHQLEYDIALGLADEVWVGTQTTDAAIEPALFEDLPVEAGILALDPDALTVNVVWHPRQLTSATQGTRILERPQGGSGNASAARFEYVDPATKEERRLVIAERAYERGWRSFVETMRHDCRHFRLQGGDQLLPWCMAHKRTQTASECAHSCGSFEPEPPSWRTKEWPLDGGPGQRYRQLLGDRRDRRRPDPQDVS